MVYIVTFCVVFAASFLGTTASFLWLSGKSKRVSPVVVPEGTKIPFPGTSSKTGVWRSKETVAETGDKA